jgi:hypothetical protein
MPFVYLYHCGKFHHKVTIRSLFIKTWTLTVDLDLERDLLKRFRSSLSITVPSFKAI